MCQYTVKEIADLAGVSIRTLHHYHEIGLLEPRHIGANGYRYYSKAEALRLHQITLYRSFGIGLSEISSILSNPRSDALTALRGQKARLKKEAQRLHALIRSLDHTIDNFIGDTKMPLEKLYKAFPPEKQEAYEAELTDAGIDIAKSKSRYEGKTKAKNQAEMGYLQDIEGAFIANMQEGLPATADSNAALVQRHRAWVGNMWGRECTPEAHVGLAQMYESHPDFNQRYETLANGFTAYICSAIRAHSG